MTSTPMPPPTEEATQDRLAASPSESARRARGRGDPGADPDVGRPRTASAVESLPGSMRRVAMYHFGWEHADGTPAAGDAGKAIRPALVLAAARALGGDRADAVTAAVAVELVHNFTLLHDDVIDGDTTRRHRRHRLDGVRRRRRDHRRGRHEALALRLLAEDPASGLARGLGPARGLRHRAVRGAAGGQCLRAARARTRSRWTSAWRWRGQDGRSAGHFVCPRRAVRGRGRGGGRRARRVRAGGRASRSSSSTT